MPLFEAATAPMNRGAKHSGDVGVTDNSRTYFRETSGRFPELSGNFLGATFRKKSTKKRKAKTKKTKKSPPLSPSDYPGGELTEEEAGALLSSSVGETQA